MDEVTGLIVSLLENSSTGMSISQLQERILSEEGIRVDLVGLEQRLNELIKSNQVNYFGTTYQILGQVPVL